MGMRLPVLVLLVATAVASFAQTTTGTVTDRVTDGSGAPVPQAKLTLTEWGIRGTGVLTYDDINFEQFFGGTLDETPGPTYGDSTNVPWFGKCRSTGGNAALDLTGRSGIFRFTHTLLIGTDYYQLDSSNRAFVDGRAPIDTINIFRPVFGRHTAYGVHDALKNTPPDWASIGNTGWRSIYPQDQIQLRENLHLLLGGRYDWARAATGRMTLEYAPLGTTLNDIAATVSDERKFRPEIGLTYQPRGWPSLFDNYVNSLGTCGTTNVIATDVSGDPLPEGDPHE